MVDYALVHDGQIIETGRPTRALVTEPEYEDVQNEDGLWERVETGRSREVLTTVSVSSEDEVDFDSLGWVPIVEQGRDESRPQTPGQIEVIEGVLTRVWKNQTGIFSSADTIPADGSTTTTVTLRFGDDETPWPDLVDVEVNGLEDTVSVTSAGNAFLDVAASTPGPVVVRMHDHSITITAE